MRGGYGREGAAGDDDTNALIGHLGGRRSRAGCGGRPCCNVLREFASFVWDHPTQQLQLRLCYTTAAGKSHIKMYQQMRMAGHPSVSVFSKKIWKHSNEINRRTPPGGTSKSEPISGKGITACQTLPYTYTLRVYFPILFQYFFGNLTHLNASCFLPFFTGIFMYTQLL